MQKIRLIHLFWRYGWLKNPVIWLAENNLAYNSGKTIQIFIIEQIHEKLMTTFFNKFEKKTILGPFSQFRG